MATWYKSGTVNVTNGSTAVVGVGTLWQLNGVTTGDLFTLDGDTFYEIAAVTGETAITLASNYGGTTQTGQTYAIIRNMTNTTNAELASKVSSLLNSWQTREDEFRAWHGGVANGGPGGDGRYPLTDALGNTQNIACPAKLAANVLSPSLDTLSVDTAYKTLIVDSVNHRVGVGTATPTEKLDVSGNAKVSGTLAINGSTIHLNYASAGYNRAIYGSTNGSYRWGMRLGNSAAESGSNVGSDFELNRYDDVGSYIGAVVYVRRSDGKVGIGTASPVGSLHVAGNETIGGVANSTRLVVGGGGDNADAILHFIDQADGWNIRHKGSDNSLRFANTIGGTDRFVIDQDGNALIGTALSTIYTSAGRAVNVSASTGHTRLALQGATTSDYAAIDFGAGAQRNAVVQANNDGSLSVLTNAIAGGVAVTERLRVTSTGVGIGTTGPSEKLEVAGSIKASGVLRSTATAVSVEVPNLQVRGSSTHGIVEGRAGGNLYLRSGTSTVTGGHIALADLYSGNVGIGLSAPTEKLEVLGVGKFTQGIKLGSGTTALSNYEEGVWVPSLIGSSVAGDQGYAVQVGRYTRIGRMVFFTATISLFSKDAAMSGQIRITGLPVSAAATGCAQGCDIGSVGGVTLATGYTMLTAQIDSGADYIRLMQAGSGQFVNVIQAADVSATFAITISGSYEV